MTNIEFWQMTGIHLSTEAFDSIHKDYMKSGLGKQGFAEKWLAEGGWKLAVAQLEDLWEEIVYKNKQIEMLEDELEELRNG